MNPNLPVGGSAFDLELGTRSALPEGLTQLGVSTQYSSFRSVYTDGERTDALGDPALDAVNVALGLRHFFGDGWSADLSLPVGLVRYSEGSGRPWGRLSGLGDLELGGRYDFAALWGAGGYRPSVALRLDVRLPTGKQERLSAAGLPPNLLSIGGAAFSAGARLDATQFVTRILGLKASASVHQPLSATANGLSAGTSIGWGLGVFTMPLDALTVAADLTGHHQGSAIEQGVGEVISSGGSLLAIETAVGFRVSERATIAASMRLPLARSVNGTQISDTVGLGAALVLSFGGKDPHDHGDEHDHGDGDAHDHSDKHDHGDAHGHGDAHDGGDAHHVDDAHDRGDKHDHGHSPSGAHADPKAPSRRLSSSEAQGDVRDAATGGATFAIDAVVVPGRITVVDFWAEWCKPCHELDALLRRLAAKHPELAVRRVEVPTFDSPVAVEHLSTASGLPVIWIYDANGTRVVEVEGIGADGVEALLLPRLSE